MAGVGGGDFDGSIADVRKDNALHTGEEYSDAKKGKPMSPDDDDRFSEHLSSDDGPQSLGLSLNTTENLSLTLPARQFTKLEVVQARQIEALVQGHHVFLALGLLFSLIVVCLVNTEYLRIWDTPEHDGWTFDIRSYEIPKGFVLFNRISAILTFTYSLVLCIIFTTRILRMKAQERTREQIWVIMLLLALVFYFNPIVAVIKIHDSRLDISADRDLFWGAKDWFSRLEKTCLTLRVSGFTGATLFYLWASIHSYRMLETEIGLLFYVPKLLILAVYVASKIIVTIRLDIYPSEMVFATFVGMLSVYGTANYWPTPGVVYATLSFAFELLLVGYIIFEIKKTKDVLKKADYLHYRTKQIGFRFFMYHNLTFYAAFFGLYVLLLAGLPNGANVFFLRLDNLQVSFFQLPDFGFGINVMLLAYATVEAYANLPADALGLMGWFTPQMPKGIGAEKSELEPITYRKREPPSFNGVVSDLSVSCFVMQTHVTMFNFAWLVYYWDTPKVDNFKLTQDVFKFTIAEYIKDTPTDTHVLVVDGKDRIVIAFKGTTSTKNLKTDINMFYSNVKGLLPTMLGEEDQEGDAAALANPLLKSHDWRWSKVHKGFAVAYKAIGPQLLSVIKRLQDERRRPVFLTGHSLGGALATVCSIDLFLRLGLTRREIFVSTFGAPRVGNRQFWNVYNENVPIHWRIVVGPDVVAKLPKVGYRHVGKKVLLTVDGDLFIDPNSLELNMWSGDAASILYHRKASYLLAMRAWCERHHGDEYLPEFWPFPVSKDDTRRFQHAMGKSLHTSGSSSSIVTGNATRQYGNKRARIMQLDAMIDALEGPDVPLAVRERWTKLTRALLAASDGYDEEMGQPETGSRVA